VELLGPADLVESVRREREIDLEPLGDAHVVRHVIRLAVGLESAVVGEDQVLHQLRAAVRRARADAPLDPTLDHLLDLALRAGRRARTWLPAQRPSLADAALDAALRGDGRAAGPVLVVGTGPIGRLTVGAARTRGQPVLVASRTAASARRIAEAFGASAVPFDPGADVLARASAVVVALAGGWSLSEPSAAALVRSAARVVDLSSPPALADAFAARLGSRLTSIDDLADEAPSLPDRLTERLDALVDRTERELAAWRAAAAERSVARALADRAVLARTVELDALWRRVPDLDPDARLEIERMAAQLANRLLREPLERLGEDADGRHGRAVADVFRL
jgi:glutamyl-tRNA reductase